MPDSPLVRVATRGSALALAQCEWAVDLLRRAHPDSRWELSTVSTHGDQRRDVPLAALAGTDGVFTRAVEEELLAGRAELAVHSLKDLPTALDERLELAAFPERADPRDVLISNSGQRFAELPAGAVVGTSSPRRAALVLSLRPDLRVVSVRGNVDTRLRKLAAGEADALLLAAAGLVRLGRPEVVTEWLSIEQFTPAVGQGALAVQCRADDRVTRALLATIDHQPTRQAVLAERVFLRAVGGGCRLPLAAHGVVDGDRLRLHGFLAGPRGEQPRRVTLAGPVEQPAALGQALAEELLRVADPATLVEARGG